MYRLRAWEQDGRWRAELTAPDGEMVLVAAGREKSAVIAHVFDSLPEHGIDRSEVEIVKESVQ